MKKLTLLTLALMLLLPSCMDRPDQLDNTEPETEAETEYTPPPKDYLDQLSLDPGYADFPDSVWCYQKAVIDEDDFVSADEIAFDPDNPAEERFISYNYTRTVEFLLDENAPEYAETTGYITHYPNVNYLTYADGIREKLCPHTDCREDFYEPCTHVDLSNGKIVGDWVYFIGQNFCAAAPSNPKRGENGYVNMLLRYSLSEHRIEKYLDLPDRAYNCFTAYGVLYIELTDPFSGTKYFLLIDEDGKTAKAPFVSSVKTPLDGYLWGTYGGKVCRASHDLTAREEITLKNAGNPSIRGSAGGRLYLMLALPVHTENNAEAERYIVTLDSKLKETALLGGIFDFVVTEDYLYMLNHDTSLAFTITDSLGEERKYYRNCDNKVIRYSLNSNGTISGEGVVVFDSAADASGEGEHIIGIERYGDYVKVRTFFAPPSEENNLPGTRTYIITDEGAKEDGEGLYHSASYQ